MPQVGFEPTIPAFGRAKAVHALDRTAIVIGSESLWRHKFFFKMRTLTQVQGKEGIRFIFKY
jgi:hypothetical protein